MSKVIFFLPAGTIEWGVPPDAQKDFSFGVMVKTIRADGFFMAPDMYLRHDAMIGMVFQAEGTNAPAIVAGMTKQ